MLLSMISKKIFALHNLKKKTVLLASCFVRLITQLFDFNSLTVISLKMGFRKARMNPPFKLQFFEMKTVSNLIVTKSVETKNVFNSFLLFSVHLSQIELRRLAWNLR